GRSVSRGRFRSAARAASRIRTSSGACGCTGLPALSTTGIGAVISVSDSGGTSSLRMTRSSGRWEGPGGSFLMGSTLTVSPPFPALDPLLLGANGVVGPGLLGGEQLVDERHQQPGDRLHSPLGVGRIRQRLFAGDGAEEGLRGGIEPLWCGRGAAVGGGELRAFALHALANGVSRADPPPLALGGDGHRAFLSSSDRFGRWAPVRWTNASPTLRTCGGFRADQGPVRTAYRSPRRPRDAFRTAASDRVLQTRRRPRVRGSVRQTLHPASRRGRKGRGETAPARAGVRRLARQVPARDLAQRQPARTGRGVHLDPRVEG